MSGVDGGYGGPSWGKVPVSLGHLSSFLDHPLSVESRYSECDKSIYLGRRVRFVIIGLVSTFTVYLLSLLKDRTSK